MTVVSSQAWGGAASASSGSANLSVVAGFVTALLFLLANPFLALFSVALVSLFQRVPPLSIVLSASISFALFFYSREYGIEWYQGGSTDDVPLYISMYNSDYGLGFIELFSRFLEVPSGNEPLWHLPWWILANTLESSDETFVFLHYLLLFLALFLAICTLSGRHLAPLALVYFLLIPISIDGAAHIWRQQLAGFMFMAGAGLLLVRHQRGGQWLMFLSPLVHLSSIFFLSFYIAYRILERWRLFEHRGRTLVVLMSILLVMPAVTSVVAVYLDAIGLAKIMAYFEADAGNRLRIYLLIGAYAVPQVAVYWLLRCDDFNRFALVLCFAVFSIVLAVPAANGIYDRLLMFTLPLLSIYLYRSMVINFSAGWRVPAVALVFAVGVSRLYAPTAIGDGPGSYLAYGHAFDPTMGLLKMLTSL